jgi:hypothetical protein
MATNRPADRPMTHPPADRFRPGDTWRSPRGTTYYVVSRDHRGRVQLRNVDNPRSTQYRGDTATGNNSGRQAFCDAWFRVDPPTAP